MRLGGAESQAYGLLCRHRTGDPVTLQLQAAEVTASRPDSRSPPLQQPAGERAVDLDPVRRQVCVHSCGGNRGANGGEVSIPSSSGLHSSPDDNCSLKGDKLSQSLLRQVCIRPLLEDRRVVRRRVSIPSSSGLHSSNGCDISGFDCSVSIPSSSGLHSSLFQTPGCSL